VAVEAATVAGNERLADHLSLVHVEAREVAPLVRPGQLVLVRCADAEFPVWDPFLPRAFFVFAVDRSVGRLSVLVERRGRGSAWLAARDEGDRVLLHGPVGREVKPARLTKHLLLLAEGVVGTAALALLSSEAAARGLSVTLVENAAPGSGGAPPQVLRADVEYRATSPEAGGLLGALPALLPWADEVVAAASAGLLETMQSLRRARMAPFTLHANVPIQAVPLVGPTRGGSGGDALPCGTGACGACGVRQRDGVHLFCQDGPAFALEDLRFDEPDEQ
jgi:dihydroorotate dehydrogenase electron transfer subunit